MDKTENISIHEVFADLDVIEVEKMAHLHIFQSTRSSQTSTGKHCFQQHFYDISIHEVFADLDFLTLPTLHLQNNFNPRGLRRPRRKRYWFTVKDCPISIHEVFADLDPRPASIGRQPSNFNPRGLRRPRRYPVKMPLLASKFQSTRSSQTSTSSLTSHSLLTMISIHEVFADLDRSWRSGSRNSTDFNPRGLRRPRHSEGTDQKS